MYTAIARQCPDTGAKPALWSSEIWLGDFNLNIRVGQLECGLARRSSPDVKSAQTPRAKKLRRLMRRQSEADLVCSQLLPINARAPLLLAQFTSVQVAGVPGRAEVEYCALFPYCRANVD